jgi:hypothetical protein
LLPHRDHSCLVGPDRDREDDLLVLQEWSRWGSNPNDPDSNYSPFPWVRQPAGECYDFRTRTIMPKFRRILNPISIPISHWHTMDLLLPDPFPPPDFRTRKYHVPDHGTWSAVEYCNGSRVRRGEWVGNRGRWGCSPIGTILVLWVRTGIERMISWSCFWAGLFCYDFRTRKYHVPDHGTWSAVEYCNGSRVRRGEWVPHPINCHQRLCFP